MRHSILVIALLISGCSTHFTKPDSTEQSYQKDWTECEVMMGQAGIVPHAFRTSPFMERCMVGKGWAKE